MYICSILRIISLPSMMCFISDVEDGFLIPTHHRQAFADRLCLLMGDEELRKEMGKRAIVSSQRFSADKIMPMWKELFEKLTSLS
jgi:glycosyltransferase involved in cell wall biosynthesis